MSANRWTAVTLTIITIKVMDWRTRGSMDVQPLALSEPEIDDLMAYPASLTSPQYRNLVNANIRGGSLYPN